MSGIIGSVRDIINVTLKTRHDSYTDQYNRIFMVKMMFVGTILLGLNWYHDKIKCIVPSNLGLSEGFVGDSCWIQGRIMVYQQTLTMMVTMKMESSALSILHGST